MLYSKLTSALRRLEVQLVVPVLFLASSTLADQPKKRKYIARLISPGFLIRLKGPLATFSADESTFDSATGKAATDIDSLLAEYDIQDNATLIGILNAKLALQELKGDAAGGLETVAKLRELQTKPDLKLTVGLFDESVLKAQQSVPSKEGADYQAKVESIYQEAVNALPWETVQDVAKSARSMAGLDSEQLILGRAQHDLQPEIDHTGALSRDSMYEVLQMRAELRTKLPLNTLRAKVLKAYVAAHDTQKPDIWAARNVTLTNSEHPQKVLVGVWDNGVDTSVYPGVTYSYGKPGPYPAQGLAFTDDGYPANSPLYPLTPERKKQYPEVTEKSRGHSGSPSWNRTCVTDEIQTTHGEDVEGRCEFNV